MKISASVIVLCALCALSSSAHTYYVWPGSPSSGIPYDSWATAAHDIQAAVDAAADGDTVVVTNGTYQLTSMISVDDAITIESVNGSDLTIIDGQGMVRCVRLRSWIMDTIPVVLRGFTLLNGNAGSDDGGGVDAFAFTGSLGCRVEQCCVRGCVADNGGAVRLGCNSVLVDCRFENNVVDGSSGLGGAVYCDGSEWTIERCVVVSNSAAYGGGVYAKKNGLLDNSLVVWNEAAQEGGGLYADWSDGTVVNCTFVYNSASGDGGGAYIDVGGVVNSIFYYNCGSYLPVERNLRVGGGSCVYSCVREEITGEGNIYQEPVFKGEGFRWSWRSLCRNAGTNIASVASVDLDTLPRIEEGRVDMGCYEFQTPSPVSYVDLDGSNTSPYDSWATAAHSIQDAVEIVAESGTVWVADGVYVLSEQIYIEKMISLISVNGREQTIIDGDGAVRGIDVWYAHLSGPPLIHGFTVTNCFNDQGAGMRIWGGTVRYCRVTGCSGSVGVYVSREGSLIEDCIVDHCDGGLRVLNGAHIERCVVRNNKVGDSCGGVDMSYGTMANCLIYSNASVSFGGASCDDGLILNCTIYGNIASNSAGGVLVKGDGIVSNSVIWGNSAPQYPEWRLSNNGVIHYSCTTPDPGGTGNISVDPQLCSPSGGDYRLRPTSPCVNIGGTYSGQPFDINMNSRIVNGVIDMGCYEYAVPGMTYVDLSGGHIPPFDSWGAASTNIQDAVDVVATNGYVWVADGSYAIGGRVHPGYPLLNRVYLDKAVSVVSENGPGSAVLDMSGVPVRGAYLVDGALLSGFQIKYAETYLSGNRIYNSSGAGALLDGGGVVSNCVFRNCEESFYGGGAFCYNGGVVTHCEIISCGAFYGGGVFLQGGGEVRNSLIRNCGCDYFGGGVCVDTDGMVLSCTIADNEAWQSGGGIFSIGDGTFRNSIIYYNIVDGELDNWGYQGNAPKVDNCCLYPHSGDHNCITNNPMFSSAAYDYTLKPSSPCIDTGTAFIDISFDLIGIPRPLDGDDNGVSAYDMGCYEFLHKGADTDGDNSGDMDEIYADTNPLDSNDYFHITAVSVNSSCSMVFNSSVDRNYTLLGCTNLTEGAWQLLIGPRVGVGGMDSMMDSGSSPSKFYKLIVELP